MGKLMIHGEVANKTIETLGIHTGQSKAKVLGVPLVADKVGRLGEDVILNYNPEDDYIYINGQKWKRAYFKKDVIYKDGEEGVETTSTTYTTITYGSNYTPDTTQPVIVGSQYVTIPPASNTNKNVCYATAHKVDVTNFSKLVAKGSYGTSVGQYPFDIEIDLSNVSEEVYVVCSVLYTGSQYLRHICVSKSLIEFAQSGVVVGSYMLDRNQYSYSLFINELYFE